MVQPAIYVTWMIRKHLRQQLENYWTMLVFDGKWGMQHKHNKP